MVRNIPYIEKDVTNIDKYLIYIDTTATADVQIPNQLVGWILLSVSVAAPQVAYYWTLFWWPLKGINSCS